MQRSSFLIIICINMINSSKITSFCARKEEKKQIFQHTLSIYVKAYGNQFSYFLNFTNDQ